MIDTEPLIELREAVHNLLAVINRDGGHRTEMFGKLSEAVKDAQATVVDLLESIGEYP